jgi:hypothetical protein
MDARGDGLQLCFSTDSRHLFGLQVSTVVVAGDGKGGIALSAFENLPTSAPMKKAAQKARVVLDLFFLIVTLSCLGFALFKSLH